MMKPCFVRLVVLVVVLLMPAGGLAASVHPIWGPSRQLQPFQPQIPSSLSLPYQSRPQVVNAALLKERICQRVERRFSDDLRVAVRINERFGFSCALTVARPSGGATLTVALDSFTSVGDAIPKGARRVPMLRFDFTASCDRDVSVDSMTVTDRGHGLASDVIGVWMSMDGRRLTASRRLKKDKTADIRFSPPLVVPACATIAVDALAAFAQSALETGRHSLTIAGADDVVADAEIAGMFPIAGEQFKISALAAGTITVTYQPVFDQAAFIAGSERQVIGSFSAEADMQEDQVLHAMTLENAGQAQDGEFVAIYARAAAGRARFTEIIGETSGDRVTLPFDPPHIIRKGGRVDFEIVADVVDGTGGTILMRFEDPSDLFSVGARSGYGDNGQLYGARVIVEGEPKKVRIR